MPAMFSRVHFSGWTPRLMAAFSAGRPERVPADRVQDVEAAHALVARDHVGDAVVADVADVDVARGVGQHLQAVELRPGRVLRDLEGAGLAPSAAASASRSLRSRNRSWWQVDKGKC